MNNTPQATWDACLKEIEKSVTAVDFNQWFAPLKAIEFDGTTITLAVPTAFYAETIEKRFLNQLAAALKSVIGPNVRLRYSVSVVSGAQLDVETQTQPQPTGKAPVGGYSSEPLIKDPYKIAAVRGPLSDPQLNAAYTFETYVRGASNKFAVSMAEVVAAQPGKTAFNPLFFYGGPGVGKTHLIQAVGARARALNEGLSVAYLSADRFMRQYMDARSANEINGFIHFYQSIGLLILDDIQELGGRAGTADAFFQIFNHLLLNGRQVVLAADKQPSELMGLHERLLSRFRSGMMLEVLPPDQEMRLGIVRAKAGAEGLSLPDEVVQYVASNVSGNARELQGALISLLAYATLGNTDVNLALAQKVVSGLVSKPKIEMLTKDVIVNTVCEYYNIEPELMRKNTRKRETVIARQIAMFLCKKHTTDSLSTIGMFLGNKNHSTVVYACRAIEGLMESDPKVAEAVRSIEESFK